MAVLLRAEPSHQLVTPVHDGAVERTLGEVGGAVPPARVLQYRLAVETHVGERNAGEGKLPERARDCPLVVESVQPVPAHKRAVTGSVLSATRPILVRVQHRGLEAAPLEMRVALADLLFTQARERQQRGR